MMKKIAFLLFAGTVMMASSSGDTVAGPKGLTAELATNNAATFHVQLSVDHRNNAYHVGDLLTATVTSSRSGWLYVLHENADGKVSVVFPNKHQRSNRIAANTSVNIPSERDDFRLRVTLPTGVETLTALVTRRQVRILEQLDLRANDATPIDDSWSREKGLLVQEFKSRRADWAGASAILRVTNGRQPVYSQFAPIQKPMVRQQPKVNSRRHQRTLIVVGIGPGFLDSKIRALRAADDDARQFMATLKRHGQIDHCILLLNEDATKQKIRRAFQEAARVTDPDGEVIIYISTHGIRVSALQPTSEADGFDEAIVCADSRLPAIGPNRDTFILDHELADWFESFGNRRVVAILDMCYAGGFAAKGLGSFAEGLVDDTQRMLQRNAATKNIDRQETAILASSQEDELSFERRTGYASVLTFELLELIQSSRGPICIRQAAKHVIPKVAAYVARTFATNQHPVLVDRLSKTVFLRTR